MNNLEERHLKIVGKTAVADFGLICTQLIAIESRLQALTEFVIKDATKDQKIKFYQSMSDHRKEMEIMIYNLYGSANNP